MNLINLITKWLFRFETARGRMLILLTLLQILTFTAVWNFSSIDGIMFALICIIGVIILGYFMDKIKFQHAYINETAIRNPIFNKIIDNQKKIMEKLNIQ